MIRLDADESCYLKADDYAQTFAEEEAKTGKPNTPAESA